MKCSVLIDCSLISKEDVLILNAQNKDIHYSFAESNNFLPPEVILLLIELVQNIGYNAAYDIIKYALMKVVSLFKNKKADCAEFHFEILCDGKIFSLKVSTALTEQQMDKLVDTAAVALLSEWNCKENLDEKQ